MKMFLLPNGKTVERDATHCVAILRGNRWTHKWFKSLRGADNEIKFWQRASASTKAYYNVDKFQLVKGN
ncbi:hypothetical protein EBT31_10470 [bacterium]|jgi:hypothetical protein|nr:hypothetical protein [bacterium]